RSAASTWRTPRRATSRSAAWTATRSKTTPGARANPCPSSSAGSRQYSRTRLRWSRLNHEIHETHEVGLREFREFRGSTQSGASSVEAPSARAARCDVEEREAEEHGRLPAVLDGQDRPREVGDEERERHLAAGDE